MVQIYKRLFNNTIWVGISRIVRAIVGFISIPLILSYFTKEQYGLIVLAASLNVYLTILNLGLPTGIVKHTAGWLATNNFSELSRAARSSFLFYLIIGTLNGLFLIYIAFWGIDFFNVSQELRYDYQLIILITAGSALLIWPFSIFDQLLQGAEEIAWLQYINIFRSLIRLVIILIAINLKMNLILFYLLLTLIPIIILPLKLYKWKEYLSLKTTILPGWFWLTFKKIFAFSVGLFILGMAKVSLVELRPIILATRVDLTALTEYKVLFAITNFIIIISTISQSSILPVISKADSLGDKKTINQISFKITKYSWAILAPVIFGIAITSKQIINLYVGENYIHLWPWLSVWSLAMFQTYLGTISSVFIGRGKIKFLVYFIPLNSVISLTVIWIIAPIYGVGSVAIGHFVYTFLQAILFHVFFLPKILNISGLKIIKESFFPPFFSALVMALLTIIVFTYFVNIENNILCFTLEVIFAAITYIAMIPFFIIKPNEFSKIKKIVLAR